MAISQPLPLVADPGGVRQHFLARVLYLHEPFASLAHTMIIYIAWARCLFQTQLPERNSYIVHCPGLQTPLLLQKTSDSNA